MAESAAARRTVHQMVGAFNPRCVICGRTPMQVYRSPFARCERMTLPFDELKPAPAKAALKTTT